MVLPGPGVVLPGGVLPWCYPVVIPVCGKAVVGGGGDGRRPLLGLYQTRLALEASSGEIDTGCGEAPPVPTAAGASRSTRVRATHMRRSSCSPLTRRRSCSSGR